MNRTKAKKLCKKPSKKKIYAKGCSYVVKNQNAFNFAAIPTPTYASQIQ